MNKEHKKEGFSYLVVFQMGWKQFLFEQTKYSTSAVCCWVIFMCVIYFKYARLFKQVICVHCYCKNTCVFVVACSCFPFFQLSFTWLPIIVYLVLECTTILQAKLWLCTLFDFGVTERCTTRYFLLWTTSTIYSSTSYALCNYFLELSKWMFVTK